MVGWTEGGGTLHGGSRGLSPFPGGAGSFRAVPNRGPGPAFVPAVNTQSRDCGCPSEADTTLGAQLPVARGSAEGAPQLGPGSPVPKRDR